jgi:hypothetical protein
MSSFKVWVTCSPDNKPFGLECGFLGNLNGTPESDPCSMKVVQHNCLQYKLYGLPILSSPIEVSNTCFSNRSVQYILLQYRFQWQANLKSPAHFAFAKTMLTRGFAFLPKDQFQKNMSKQYTPHRKVPNKTLFLSSLVCHCTKSCWSWTSLTPMASNPLLLQRWCKQQHFGTCLSFR